MGISHSFKKESMWEKAKWFLGLSLTDRYKTSFGIAELYGIIHKGKETHDRRPFKTIQVLKRKRS